MMRFDGTVLAAIELEPDPTPVLAEAGRYAFAAGQPLVVCHVLPELFRVRSMMPELHAHDETRFLELEERVRREVEALISRAGISDGVPVSVQVESGTPHAAITRLVDLLKPGLLVIGGMLPVDRYAHASVGPIVRDARCPVLVVRPSGRGPVLAATDFSIAARRAQDIAALEGHSSGAPVVLMHAVDLMPIVLPPAVGGAPVPMVNPVWLRDEAERELELARRAMGSHVLGRLVEGPAVAAIVQAARELEARLVVIGTHGRSSLARLALGSVAEPVVVEAPCSVLVVRPPLPAAWPGM